MKLFIITFIVAIYVLNAFWPKYEQHPEVIGALLKCRDGHVVSVLVDKDNKELGELPVVNVKGGCKSPENA